MKREQALKYVGVIVRGKQGAVPFSEASFYRRLSLAGRRIGVRLYVFSAEGIDWQDRVVHGYAYISKADGWRRRTFPFPALVYDRAFFRSRRQLTYHRRQLARLLSCPGVTLLGRGLYGKLETYRQLSADPDIARKLPRTTPYTGSSSLAAWLKEHGEAIFKPQGGTHGKGVLLIRKRGARTYEANGRNRKNEMIKRRFSGLRPLLLWTNAALASGRPYLIQQYIDLTNNDGYPFDIRALVQKSGDGEWQFTGAAARIGPAGSITSNLHGGGIAAEAGEFLQKEYGEEAAAEIARDIRETALAIPSVLEQQHGPLIELGIDFGVDRHGRVWVLEVNSKPGRSSFIQLNDKHVSIAAVTRPIRYAKYVLNRQLGGQMNELDVKQDPFYKEKR